MSNIFVFRQPPPGFINEYFGGGGKSQTSTQSVSIPPEVLARYNSVNAQAQTAAAQPFSQYGGEFVAPLSQTQQAGIANTNTAATQAQPYYGAATALTAGAAQNVGPLTQGQIGYYQNPYTQAVVNPTVQALQQQQGQQLAQQQAEAIKSGAAFGERSGLQRAQLQGQQNLALGQAIAPLYQQGYGQAAQLAAGQQGVVASDLARQMQAGQQLAALGQGAQSAGLQGAQAQLQAGQIPQQTQQALDTALYQQFQQQQGYPFQVAQFLANIAEGTGALSGSTTTTTQPAGFFSDKRLKTDIKKIGETNDGQPIYSYKYKGEKRTQIGLMAQDVEKKHPEAVGLMGGYKTVDYKKATKDAERPAKYAGGGLVPDGFDPSSMGGAVTPEVEGEGFARGGDAIGPYGNVGLYGGAKSYVPGPMKNEHPHHFAMGGTPYAGGYVPDAGQQQQHYLMLPPKLPTAPASGLSSAMQTGKDIQGIYNFGKQGLVGDKDSAGLIGGQGSFSGQNVFSKLGDWLKPGAATGGLIVHRDHYDSGGDVDPYEDTKDPLRDVLKTQESAKHGSLNAPGQGPGSGQSGASQLTSALGLGKGLMDFGSAASDFFSAAPEVMAGLLASGGTVDRQHFAGDDGESGAVLPLDTAAVEAQPGLNPDAVAAAAAEDKAPAVVPAKMKGLVVDRPAEPKYSPEELSRFGNAAIQHIIGTESGGDPRAHATTSSAAGLGQFTDSTAKSVLQRHPEIAQGVEYNPMQRGFAATLPAEVQQAMIAAHAADQAGVLARQGFEPTPQNIKANWFLGEAGGPAFLKGLQRDPTAPGYLLAGADQVNANQNVFFNKDGSPRSAQEVMDKINSVGGGAGGGRGPVPPGLVGAGMQAAPSDGSSLYDKATSANFVVPALGFLGSMLASQRPTLGGAIGEGMLGGVGAYRAQQQQNAAMAKNVLDIVKDRFVVSVDPDTNQTVYFNKSTGAKLNPNQYAQAVGNVADSLGVSRGVLGIPTTDIAVPGVSGPSGKPSQTSGQAAAPSQTQATGAKPAADTGAAAKPVDFTTMSPTQQKQYVIEHASEYGLVDDRDPAAMQAVVNRYRNAEKLAIQQGNTAQAADFAKQAADAQKRKDDYLTDAVSSQTKINDEYNKSIVGDAADYRKGVNERLTTYDDDRSKMLRLAQIASEYSMGRGADIKATIGDWARNAGIDLGPKFAAAPPDEALKIATSQAIDNVAYKHLGRAPAAGIKSELLTVPRPEMAPGAIYSVVGRTLGEMDHAHARDMDYSNLGGGANVTKFLANWDKKDPTPFIRNAFSEIPVAKGADPAYVASLEKTYGFQHKEPGQPAGNTAQGRQQAPAAPQAPEPIRNLQGLEYSPRRNQYRDAQGNIYDASGKRVQ